MLNKLQEAIAAGRHAVDLLEAQLAELVAGAPRYIVGSQGRYELAHRALHTAALTALDLHHATQHESVLVTYDTAGELQDTMTAPELRQLLRTAASARIAEWGSQEYEGDDFTDADGILDPFDFSRAPVLLESHVA